MTCIASTQNWEAQNLKHHVLISIVAVGGVDGSKCPTSCLLAFRMGRDSVNRHRKKSTTWLWTQVFAHTQPLVLFCGLRLKVPFHNTMVVAWMAGPMSIYVYLWFQCGHWSCTSLSKSKNPQKSRFSKEHHLSRPWHVRFTALPRLCSHALAAC